MPPMRTPSWTNPGIPRQRSQGMGRINMSNSASMTNPFNIRNMFTSPANPQQAYNAPRVVQGDEAIAQAESQAILAEMYARQRAAQQSGQVPRAPSNAVGQVPRTQNYTPPPTTPQQPMPEIPDESNFPLPEVPNEGNYPMPEVPNDSALMAELMRQIQANQGQLRGGYDSLMSQLQGNLNRPEETYQDYVPEEQTYSSSPENKRAMKMLEELSLSGGYSDADKNNIRARGVAPIRSVYAQAQEGLNRQKALQGGYSPNSAAASSKMTRELADRISGQTTNINADLAEKVASGKMQMAPQFAQFAGRENELINEILGRNVGAKNDASQFNRGMQSKVFQGNRGNRNDIMSQIQQLFGTNANMTNDFTNQIMSHAEMGQRGGQNQFQNRMSQIKMGQGNRQTQFQNRMSQAELAQRNRQNRFQNRMSVRT